MKYKILKNMYSLSPFGLFVPEACLPELQKLYEKHKAEVDELLSRYEDVCPFHMTCRDNGATEIYYSLPKETEDKLVWHLDRSKVPTCEIGDVYMIYDKGNHITKFGKIAEEIYMYENEIEEEDDDDSGEEEDWSNGRE